MTGERSLVTGAAGFVGSHMAEHLADRGLPVRATDLPAADASTLKRRGIEFVPADLTSPQGLRDVVAGCDVVYHYASLHSFSAPLEMLRRVNVDASRHLYDACVAEGVKRVVVFSSGSVYGRPERIPCDETLPLKPRSDYAVSKDEQEQVTRRYAQKGLDHTILRPGAIYGPRSRTGAAVPLFLLALGQMPAIPGRGDVYGAMVHVRDVVEAALHLAHHPKAANETFNVADDTLLTIEDIIFILAPLVDAKVYDVHLPEWGLKLLSWWNTRRARRTGRPPRIEKDALEFLMDDTFMSNKKLKATGYRMRYPNYVVGMVETIEWYKTHNWLWRDRAYRDKMTHMEGEL